MEMQPKIAFKDCSKQGKIKYIQDYIKEHLGKSITEIAKHFNVSTTLVHDYSSEKTIQKKRDIKPLLENLSYQIALTLEREDASLFERIKEQIALKRNGEVSFDTEVEKPTKRSWNRIYKGLE